METLHIDGDTCLRALTLKDAPELFAVVQANREFLRPILGWVDGTTEAAHMTDFIQTITESALADKSLIFCIQHESAIVGVCGFRSIDRDHKLAEVGYWLAESSTGRGIMLRSVGALLERGFSSLQLNRIELRADVHNAPSRAVAERLGFEREGVLREALWLHGEPISLVVYSMLQREWKAKATQAADAPCVS